MKFSRFFRRYIFCFTYSFFIEYFPVWKPFLLYSLHQISFKQPSTIIRSQRPELLIISFHYGRFSEYIRYLKLENQKNYFKIKLKEISIFSNSFEIAASINGTIEFSIIFNFSVYISVQRTKWKHLLIVLQLERTMDILSSYFF